VTSILAGHVTRHISHCIDDCVSSVHISLKNEEIREHVGRSTHTYTKTISPGEIGTTESFCEKIHTRESAYLKNAKESLFQTISIEKDECVHDESLIVFPLLTNFNGSVNRRTLKYVVQSLSTDTCAIHIRVLANDRLRRRRLPSYIHIGYVYYKNVRSSPTNSPSR